MKARWIFEPSTVDRRPTDPICYDLEARLENLSGHIAERYLAWALLHVCRGRFELAGIYSKSAVDFGALLAGQAADSAFNEGQLLFVQVRRLGGLPEGLEDRRAEAFSRFAEMDRRLNSIHADTDTRVLLERAAQIIELTLTVGDCIEEGKSLSDAVALLAQALTAGRALKDGYTEGRALTLLLVSVLASLRSDVTWPLVCGEPVARAGLWHRELIELLQSDHCPEEIPSLTRAMQIIGYLIKGGMWVSRSSRVKLIAKRTQSNPTHNPWVHLLPSSILKLAKRRTRFPSWSPSNFKRLHEVCSDTNNGRSSTLPSGRPTVTKR